MPKGQLQGGLAVSVAVIAACGMPAGPVFSGEAPSAPSIEAQAETGAPPPASTTQFRAPSGGAGMTAEEGAEGLLPV